MTQEEDREDDDLEDHEVLRDEGEARRFRSPAPDPSNMVGLVCPRYSRFWPLIGPDCSGYWPLIGPN